MSEKKKPELVSLTTPIGEFQYPHLTKPDYGNEEVSYPNGRYSATLLLDKGDEADAFIAVLEDHLKVALATLGVKGGSSKPWKRDDDGRWQIRSWVHYHVLNPAKDLDFHNEVLVCDTNRNPITDDVWSGSRGRISFEIIPYSQFGGGITLRLRAAQITELVTGKPKSADDFFPDDLPSSTVDSASSGLSARASAALEAFDVEHEAGPPF